MKPQPLLRVTADIRFNHLSKFGSVGDDVGLIVTSPDQLDSRIKSQNIFAKLCVPYSEARDHSGIGAQSDPGKPAGCTCRDPEEIDENTLRRSHVSVHQDADGLA